MTRHCNTGLYAPTKIALPRVYSALSVGGLIVVDDCAQGTPWDGAYEAYQEFVRERNIEEEIACRKLGVIRKRRATA